MNRSHEWISEHTTRLKEDDFAGLVRGIHLRACAGIRAKHGRPGDPPYVFVDLHAGPGRCQDSEGPFDGSPLIAAAALQQSGLPHETWHFEKDPAVAAELSAALDPVVYPYSTVVGRSFEEGVPKWLENTRPHSYRYGLVYADPWKNTNGTPVPVDIFNAVAEHSPRMDLLAYIAANSHYKRSGLIRQGRRLADDIALVRKKHVLIREDKGAEQFTFILFSDFPFGEWKSHGFYDLNSRKGQTLLRKLNWTIEELEAQDQMLLWGDDAA